MGKRCCFVVETPFQVMNSIKIRYAEQLEDCECDIYIGRVFTNIEDIVSRIKQLRIFNNVYIYDPKRYKELAPIKKAFIMLNPYKRLRKVLDDDVKYINTCYDIAIFSTTLLPAEALVYLNTKITVYWMDDGMASYTGGFPKLETAHGRRTLLFRLAGCDPRRLYPIAIFLNNPSFCLKSASNNLIQIPSNNLEVTKKIEKVFNYRKTDLYNHYEWVYLTQPNDWNFNLDNKQYIDSVEKLLLQESNTYNFKILHRPHPRECVDKELFSKDDISNMWELVCESEINNNHVLISWFSTAQFSPVMLYNTQPWLVFLYKLYKSEKWIDSLKSKDEMIQHLKKVYSEPERIIVPETLSELKQAVHFINMKKKDN